MRKEVLAEGVEVYCEDCREILPTLGKFDAVVTDPPYGIGYAPNSSGKGKHSRRNVGMITGDDTPFDPEPWLRWPCILWGANHYSSRLPHGRWLAWNKLGTLEPWDTFSDVEFAWQNIRAADRIFSLLWKGICQDDKDDAGARAHPTQKPVRLMRWCIEQLPPPAASIIDPFMGSGTTGVAAVQLGRRFTGIEINQTYFDIACRRISEALKQQDLFVDKPPPIAPKQETLL